MAIVEVTQGTNNTKFWCVQKSGTSTWRMTWDAANVVQDLFEGTDETLNLAVLPIDPDNPNIFEGADRDECISKIEELGLYFDPEIES
jgi:hypothetical protein